MCGCGPVAPSPAHRLRVSPGESLVSGRTLLWTEGLPGFRRTGSTAPPGHGLTAFLHLSITNITVAKGRSVGVLLWCLSQGCGIQL
jgi:hypothetical protein